MDEQLERAPVGIHHGMALAPHHLLARIIAARAAAGLRCLHALAVDDRCRRARLAANANPVKLDQMMVEAFKDESITQLRKPPVNRSPRRKVVGQKPS